jgi:hypothetical protein
MGWAQMGPVASANSDPGLSESLTRLRRERGPVAPWGHAATFSPPALASLVLGSRRSETGLYEIDSGDLARVRRGHETRATRTTDRTTVSLLR